MKYSNIYSAKNNLGGLADSEGYATETGLKNNTSKFANCKILQVSAGMKLLCVAKKKNICNKIITCSIIKEVTRKEISVTTPRSTYVDENFILHAQKYTNGAWDYDCHVSHAVVKLPKSEIKEIGDEIIKEAQIKCDSQL